MHYDDMGAAAAHAEAINAPPTMSCTLKTHMGDDTDTLDSDWARNKAGYVSPLVSPVYLGTRPTKAKKGVKAANANALSARPGCTTSGAGGPHENGRPKQMLRSDWAAEKAGYVAGFFLVLSVF